MTEQFGTPEDDFAFFGIDAQQADKVYLAGFTDGSLGGANAGSFDAWVASSSLSAGSVPSGFWAKPPGSIIFLPSTQQLGSASVDIAFNVGIDRFGNIYVTGKST